MRVRIRRFVGLGGTFVDHGSKAEIAEESLGKAMASAGLLLSRHGPCAVSGEPFLGDSRSIFDRFGKGSVRFLSHSRRFVMKSGLTPALSNEPDMRLQVAARSAMQRLTKRVAVSTAK